ncbi:replicative DNA helicase [Planctomycetota bacterium]
MLEDNERSEACVLAAIMQKPKKDAIKLIDRLAEDDFNYERHIGLFRALSQLVKEDAEISVAAILDRLQLVSEELEQADEDYVQNLMDMRVTRVNGHLNIVLDLAQGRQLVEALGNVGERLKKGASPGEILINLQADLALAGRQQIRQYRFNMAETADAFYKSLQEEPDAISTGFANIDRYIVGFERGAVYIIGARPSMGKTALAVSMTHKMAKAGKRIVFFTLEMSQRAFQMRIASAISHVPIETIRKRKMNPEQLKQVEKAVQYQKKYLRTLEIVTEQFAALQQLQVIHEYTEQVGQPDLVVIDYAQLMQPGVRAENRTTAMTIVSQQVKRMAVSEDVPVLLIAQLSRKTDERKGRRPYLTDLRESGSFEQDAEAVMLLYRPSYYEERENTGQQKPDVEKPGINAEVCECYIDKNREGEPGTARLLFVPNQARFEDAASRSAGTQAEKLKPDRK